ncbi:uncharacterized protein LOC105696042 isoform X2 [Orussus abietinus]|uniref:uncharacterized protein LOC105696042 isoform X2 n=1 Tax=Orussus abietinus TaxID=222816 RepID=UPI000626B295|nr:uncharacterized protein LOC105696042 isoform X2 [Orussus abietinus]
MNCCCRRGGIVTMEENCLKIENINACENDGDTLLVDLVKSYANLYDKTHRDFKDCSIRENSWAEIARSLNSSVENCQIRWKRLRERFARERKMLEEESESDAAVFNRSKFFLYESMSYLNEHVQRRKTKRSIYQLNRPPLPKKAEPALPITQPLPSLVSLLPSPIPPLPSIPSSSAIVPFPLSTLLSPSQSSTSSCSSGSSQLVSNEDLPDTVQRPQSCSIFKNFHRKKRKIDSLENKMIHLSSNLEQIYRKLANTVAEKQELTAEDYLGKMIASTLKGMDQGKRARKMHDLIKVLYS